MPLVKRIRRRGANMVVEAHGEVLFAATGDVGRWTNRFSQRARAFTSQEAPMNKRPRWGHYGKPLKSTFTASTTYQPVRMRVYSAVGSTAPHSAYVDQGTGVYAGNGPYEAKVIPPWRRGSASLYENTWIPPGSKSRVKTVMIRGQKGQFFFDKGLSRAFQSMRMRAFQVPGDAKITDALNSVPSQLENFLGNTQPDAAFRLSLAEWREWRDAHFNAGGRLGKEGSSRPRRPSAARTRAEAAMTKKRASAKPSTPKKPTAKPKPQKPVRTGYASVADKKAAAVTQFRKQNPKIRVIRQAPGGLIVQTMKGPVMIPWSRLYGLL